MLELHGVIGETLLLRDSTVGRRPARALVVVR